MEELPTEAVNLLFQLMPGFLAAWVLYGFTSYPKPSQFERILQALIFSFLITALLPVEKYFLFLAGEYFLIGEWDKDAQIFVTAITGILFGLAASYYANNDKLYAFARKFKLTRRTAYPSEWFGAFSEKTTYIVLHLSGNRRLYGWPVQWPSEPVNGHFVLVNASWLLNDGNEISLNINEQIMVAAKDVELVEFVKMEVEDKNGAKTTKPTTTKSSNAK